MVLSLEKDGEPLDERELRDFLALFLTGGNETTRHLLAHTAIALMRHPGQLDRLLSGEVSVASAVEEMLRWSTPVMHHSRWATTDADIGGAHVRAGDRLTLWMISANHDERVFAHLIASTSAAILTRTSRSAAAARISASASTSPGWRPPSRSARCCRCSRPCDGPRAGARVDELLQRRQADAGQSRLVGHALRRSRTRRGRPPPLPTPVGKTSLGKYPIKSLIWNTPRAAGALPELDETASTTRIPSRPRTSTACSLPAGAVPGAAQLSPRRLLGLLPVRRRDRAANDHVHYTTREGVTVPPLGLPTSSVPLTTDPPEQSSTGAPSSPSSRRRRWRGSGTDPRGCHRADRVVRG